MMAEMPPSAGTVGGTVGRTMAPAKSLNRAPSFNTTYATSIANILTLIAWVCAFSSMVSYEVWKDQFWLILPISQLLLPGRFVFHEFTVVTSFVFLTIFTTVAVLSLYRVIDAGTPLMTYVMLGHSAFWFLFALISSSIIAHESVGTSVTSLKASAAFGLLESFALLGVVVVLILGALNIVPKPFE